MLKKTKDYKSSGNIKLPVTYYADIPNNNVFRKIPVVAKYTINKQDYKLNLYDMKSTKELKKKLELIETTKKDFNNYPPIKLDIDMEIENISKNIVKINISGDYNILSISSKNTNFKSIEVSDYTDEDDEDIGKIITLKPKEKYKWKLKLKSGYRDYIYNYFTEKGEYYLKIEQKLNIYSKNLRGENFSIVIDELYIKIK